MGGLISGGQLLQDAHQGGIDLGGELLVEPVARARDDDRLLEIEH